MYLAPEIYFKVRFEVSTMIKILILIFYIITLDSLRVVRKQYYFEDGGSRFL
jgi:hypothetical protein